MAKILDNWGERNAWIEIQHIFNYEKNSKILDIDCKYYPYYYPFLMVDFVI